MKLDAVARPMPDAGFGGRFYLVSYLPAYAATLFLLVLVWAGAPGWAGHPGHRMRFTDAWATASHLSLGEVVMVALAVVLLAFVLQPLQLAVVRLAEGSWPAWLGARWACRWQMSRCIAAFHRSVSGWPQRWSPCPMGWQFHRWRGSRRR